MCVFRVPISPAPQPSEVLSVEAARNSPQTASALRTLQLIKAGNVAEVREQLLPGHPVWRELETDQSGASLKMAREICLTPPLFVGSVQRVLVYRDDAIIVARHSEATQRFRFGATTASGNLRRPPFLMTDQVQVVESPTRPRRPFGGCIRSAARRERPRWSWSPWRNLRNFANRIPRSRFSAARYIQFPIRMNGAQ